MLMMLGGALKAEQLMLMMLARTKALKGWAADAHDAGPRVPGH